MKWIEATVTFDHPEPDLAADLVAALFFDLDLQGVVIEDPTLTAVADRSGDAVAGPAAYAVIGYFVGDRRGEWIADRLAAKLETLRSLIGLVCRVDYRQVDDQNWAEAWKAHFRPQRIGRHLVVKPTWQNFCPQDDDVVIELDPGMAFGTGTHPTTALCLMLIERHMTAGAAVLDVGTGSGILAIAAALLGAGSVHCIDKDEMAVRVAARNLALNQVNPERCSVSCANLLQAVGRTCDLIVANILTEVILELLDDLTRVMSPKALFICSGILRANHRSVVGKMEDLGLEPVEIHHRDEWTAIAARRR